MLCETVAFCPEIPASILKTFKKVTELSKESDSSHSSDNDKLPMRSNFGMILCW